MVRFVKSSQNKSVNSSEIEMVSIKDMHVISYE